MIIGGGGDVDVRQEAPAGHIFAILDRFGDTGAWSHGHDAAGHGQTKRKKLPSV